MPSSWRVVNRVRSSLACWRDDREFSALCPSLPFFENLETPSPSSSAEKHAERSNNGAPPWLRDEIERIERSLREI